ncbi:hypothetical protein [Streptomyces sp. KL116D]|uniref:hypothetical protein n=1 Tax=Streptomyces sp. KL116D TaxID=3045152 RepID=UPI003556014B
MPLADGTYTLADRGHRTAPADVRLSRTADGYLTIASADGARCLETRSGKLTLQRAAGPAPRT